ncbi:MAG: hypothetical protein BWY71_01943 [Planctomycetes bacterium ADurb.Bin412]|nr:MAG: hypothetical protein BWY71_01943 [Planctomycetes bacterium ADurb.Bin412]
MIEIGLQLNGAGLFLQNRRAQNGRVRLVAVGASAHREINSIAAVQKQAGVVSFVIAVALGRSVDIPAEQGDARCRRAVFHHMHIGGAKPLMSHPERRRDFIGSILWRGPAINTILPIAAGMKAAGIKRPNCAESCRQIDRKGIVVDRGITPIPAVQFQPDSPAAAGHGCSVIKSKGITRNYRGRPAVLPLPIWITSQRKILRRIPDHCPRPCNISPYQYP